MDSIVYQIELSNVPKGHLVKPVFYVQTTTLKLSFIFVNIMKKANSINPLK